jgi:hypothetical protein
MEDHSHGGMRAKVMYWKSDNIIKGVFAEVYIVWHLG